MKIREIVEKTLESFTRAKSSFSAFEVTSEIREQVRKGVYEVEGIDDFVIVDGKKTPRIRHELIRDFVVELMQSQKGYEDVIRKSKEGQSFRLYQASGSTSDPSSTSSEVPTTLSEKPKKLESEDVEI